MTHDDERFDEMLREWAAKPPRLEPEIGGAWVVTALPRRRGVSWGTLAAAAVLALAILTPWLALSPPPVVATTAVVVDDNVVLFYLDPDTPVYEVLPPVPPAKPGGTS